MHVATSSSLIWGAVAPQPGQLSRRGGFPATVRPSTCRLHCRSQQQQRHARVKPACARGLTCAGSATAAAAASQPCNGSSLTAGLTPPATQHEPSLQQQQHHQQLQDAERRQSSSQCSTSYSSSTCHAPCSRGAEQHFSTRHSSSSSSSSSSSGQSTSSSRSSSSAGSSLHAAQPCSAQVSCRSHAHHAPTAAGPEHVGPAPGPPKAAGAAVPSSTQPTRHPAPQPAAATAAVAAAAAAAAAAPGWGYLGPISLGAGLGAPRCWQRPGSSRRGVREQQRLSRGRLIVAGAAAAAVGGGTWTPAIGASMRSVLFGVVLTLGAQLLLVLLLRTLWARRALASFENWLNRTLGVSLNLGGSKTEGLDRSSSLGSSVSDRGADNPDGWGQSGGRALGGNGRPLSRAGSGASGSSSSSSSSSAYSNGSSTASDRAAMTAVVQKAPGESVEWVNMCFRKIWRVYQRGLERWITDLLQPVFDGLISPDSSPAWLLRLRIVELTLDHEAPYFSNMRRRNSRKDSDLTGVVDLRYTGGARLLLMLELGQGRWRFKIPVLVSDLDVQCALWLKLRLAPMCPWIGTISVAFVGPPAVKVQLSPYNRVRLMRIPVLQNLLNRLLTVDLPGLMVLPQRLEISIPPSVTSIAEAAVGRDTIMRAVASAVLQVDSLEQALLAALPLGPQAAAGGISLPELFRGELTVLLRGGRDLPVWGLPWQSNPWVRLVLGQQVVASRRDSETSTASRHGAPVWNQEVQFLVEDPEKQVLEVYVNDSHLTGRPKVGKATLPLTNIPRDGKLTVSLPLEPVNPGQQAQGEVLLDVSFKVFEDDEQDSGFREAQEYARTMVQPDDAITDIRSAAAASSRAAVAASAAISAIAMTKAAAARAAARTAQAAKEAGAAALSSVTQQQQQQQPLMLPPPKGEKREKKGDRKGEGSEQQEAAAAADGSSIRRGYGDSAEERQSNAAKAVSYAVAQQRRERETALAEALEARMAVRYTRSTSRGSSNVKGKTPADKQREGAAAAAAAREAAAAAEVAKVEVAAAAAAQKGVGADMTVTLPADILSDSSSEEDEAAAVARAQQAVVNILEKSRRMEAAVAELAALTAGSPAEAKLQEETLKAAAATADALKSLNATATGTITASASLTSVDIDLAAAGSSSGSSGSSSRAWRAAVGSGGGGSSSGGRGASATAVLGPEGPAGWVALPGTAAKSANDAAAVDNHVSASLSSMSEGEVVAAAAAVDSALADYQHHVETGSNGSSVDVSGNNGPATVSSSGSNGAAAASSSGSSGAHTFRDFASEYSIWDEEGSSGLWSGKTAADAAAAAVGTAAGDTAASDTAASDGSANGAAAAAAVDGAAALGAVAAAKQPAVQKDTSKRTKTTKKQQQRKPDEPKAWWAPLIAYLPGSKDRSSGGSSKDGEGSASVDADADSSSIEQQHPEPPSTLVIAEPLTQSQGHWYSQLLDNDFIRSLPGVAKKDGKEREQRDLKRGPAAEGGADSSAEDSQEGAEGGEQQQKQKDQKDKDQKPWWSAVTDLSWVPGLGGSSSDDAEGGGGANAADDGSKPVEAIVIPADLPIEEIAREVAKLKEDAWRSKEDHLENLWARTVERNDRSWLMLLCFLLSVAVGLLAVVAYRIAGLGDSGPDADTAAAAAAAAGAVGVVAGAADASAAVGDAAREAGSSDTAAAVVAAVVAAVGAAAPDAASAAGVAASGSDGTDGVTSLVTQLPVMTLAVLSWWLGQGGGGGGGDVGGM